MKTINIRPKSWVVMAYLVFLALAIWACYALLHAAWSWEPGFSLHNLFFGLIFVSPFLFGIAVVWAMILLKKITFAAEEILIAYL